MEDSFEHEVLGEIKADEMFWIFPKRVAAYFVIGMGTAALFWKLLSFTGFGAVVAIIIAAGTLVFCLVSVIKKPSRDYIKGGGYTYLEIAENRIAHKKSAKVYSLCVPTERTKKKK